MKRFLVLLLVLVLTLTCLSGCGQKDLNDVEDDMVVGDDVETEGEPTEGQELSEEELNAPAVPPEDNQVMDNNQVVVDESKDENKDENKETETQKPEKKPENNSKPQTNGSAPSGSPVEIIEKLYAQKSVDLSLNTMELDLSDEAQIKMMTGLDSSDKLSSAAVSEALIGSQAYSLVIVKLKDKKDQEKVAKEMLNGIDTRKWICVEADDLRVAATGDVVMLFMVESALSDVVTSKEMVDAFNTICGGKMDITIKR